MRPFPLGHKGLTLAANGEYGAGRRRLPEHGHREWLCAKPGDRVVLTDVKIEHSRIILAIEWRTGR